MESKKYQINDNDDLVTYIEAHPNQFNEISKIGHFDNADFNMDFNNESLDKLKKYPKLIFSHSIIKKDFILEKIVKVNPVNIEFFDVQFEKQFQISECTHLTLQFGKCEFKLSVYLLSSVFSTEFSLAATTFKSNLFFCKTEFTKIKCSGDMRFCEEVSIEETTFKGQASFINAKFIDDKLKNGGIKLVDCIIEDDASFYFDGAYLKKMEISNTIFRNIFSLCGATIDSLKINHTYFEKSPLFLSGVEAKALDRETARFLKNEAYKVNDIVLALQFKSQEMSLYRENLKKQKNKIKGFRKRVDYWGERALLCLNTCSNNNGTSWLRGLGFTLLVWFIFFSIFATLKDGGGTTLIWLDCDYWKEALKFFWNYFGIFKDFNDLDFKIPVWRLILSIIVYFLGKIGIAYGIYQTIAAFRKYRK